MTRSRERALRDYVTDGIHGSLTTNILNKSDFQGNWKEWKYFAQDSDLIEHYKKEIVTFFQAKSHVLVKTFWEEYNARQKMQLENNDENEAALTIITKSKKKWLAMAGEPVKYELRHDFRDSLCGEQWIEKQKARFRYIVSKSLSYEQKINDMNQSLNPEVQGTGRRGLGAYRPIRNPQPADDTIKYEGFKGLRYARMEAYLRNTKGRIKNIITHITNKKESEKDEDVKRDLQASIEKLTTFERGLGDGRGDQKEREQDAVEGFGLCLKHANEKDMNDFADILSSLGKILWMKDDKKSDSKYTRIQCALIDLGLDIVSAINGGVRLRDTDNKIRTLDPYFRVEKINNTKKVILSIWQKCNRMISSEQKEEPFYLKLGEVQYSTFSDPEHSQRDVDRDRKSKSKDMNVDQQDDDAYLILQVASWAEIENRKRKTFEAHCASCDRPMDEAALLRLDLAALRL